MGNGIYLKELVKDLDIKNLIEEIDYSKRKIYESDVNRTALPLAGYFDYFDGNRLQIIGLVEASYLLQLSEEKKEEVYSKLMSYHEIPAIVFCRGLEPDALFLQKALENQIPVFTSDKTTSHFTAEAIRWLGYKLAPMIRIHGVLVDVYGEGVLITGNSGIGKSETALELVKRGHHLVSDDAVEIRKISDTSLIGSAPDVTKHFIELRGIGIVDIKEMFGVSSVRESHEINLVINLEEWDREREYDRIGLEEQYTEYLGNKIVSHTIPIRPGRNLAMIVESAAINYREKQMGYNAARELYRRLQQSMAHRDVED
ncbi:MAG: HPr(Ser) kinase/phosphatase [Lachnospiraceae bacterium]|nr:HPr(Ser) kinase/phosphatase [Lachnospiraceae bacterium]